MRGFLLQSVATAVAIALPAPGGALDEPYNFVLLSRVADRPFGSDVWGYTAPDGTELAIYGHIEGTSFIDATDPRNPVEVFHLPGATSGWRDMKTYSHYAYVVTEGAGGGLQIVDLSDPLDPVHVRTYIEKGFETAHNLWIDVGAGIAYACGAGPEGGTHVLSLEDPENPVELDYNPRKYHDLYARDGILFGAKIEGQLDLLDVSDPARATLIASHHYPGRTHNVWPVSWPPVYAATTDELAVGTMKVWRLTNPNAVALLSEYRVPRATIHNVLIEDRLAYVSYYSAGTRVVDLVDPVDPLEVGTFDTSDAPGGFEGNWGVYPFRSDHVIYSSDTQGGLFILQFTGNHAGRITGSVRNAVTGATIRDAGVSVNERLQLVTDGRGNFGGRTVAAEYDVVTTAFGYFADTTRVTIPASGTARHAVSLRPLPVSDVVLRLRDPHTRRPVEGVTVRVLEGGFAEVSSDPDGRVEVRGLPVDTPVTLHCTRLGVVATTIVVEARDGEQISVAVAIPRGLSEDFEFDLGWTVGEPDDAADDGLWERVAPVGSFLFGPVGADGDASPEGDGFAYVTESHHPAFHAATSDVDEGKTTLLSPVLDLAGLEGVTLSYDRWFSNRMPEPAGDELRVDVSSDGGRSWTNVETLTEGTDSWAHVEFDLSAVIGMTSSMRLRFVAEDFPPETLVEAGVDNVEIRAAPVRSPAVGLAPDETSRELARSAEVPGSVGAPHPNPFVDRVQLDFEIGRPGPVSVAVHDVTGRRVVTLVEAPRVGAGRHRISWDGRRGGRAVAPGVYFLKVDTPHGTERRKIVRTR